MKDLIFFIHDHWVYCALAFQLICLPLCVLGVLYARLRVALRLNKDRFRTSLTHVIATPLCSVALTYILFVALVLITLLFIF